MNMAGPGLLLALLAGAAQAQGTVSPAEGTVTQGTAAPAEGTVTQGTAAPDTSPLPPERPASAVAAEATETVPQQTAPEAGDAAPEPPAREATQPAESPTPDEPPIPERLAETDLDLGTCLGRLAVYGTVFERGDAISDDGGACGIANPVRVTEIVPGVTLEPAGIMRCEAAAALADWVARFVQPASELLPGRGRVTGLANASTYVCRNRDNAAEGPLSEHAFGNAVDISAFRFAEGDRIAVQPREREGTPDEAFQRAVRAAACLEFTTVLGPGANEAHDDHLHLDVEARESGFRLCQ